MSGFGLPQWDQVFVPDASLLESFLRGVLVYFALMVVFRVFPNRQLGSLGFGDVMLVVLVSECVSQALTAKSNSVPNGIAAVSALVVCNYLTDWACYKWPRVRRVVESRPVEIVRDGRPIDENLRQERVSDDELMSQLRMNGIDDLTRVRAAFIEPEGGVSVIPKEEQAGPAGDDPHPPELEPTLRRFLEAARELQQAAAWHDRQAADHRRHAEAARSALTRHGVKPRALLAADPEPTANGTHPPDPEHN